MVKRYRPKIKIGKIFWLETENHIYLKIMIIRVGEIDQVVG